VILGDIFNPHFGLWVREIETAMFKHGYSTLIINTDEDASIEHDAITTAISKRVDGIIICPTQKQNENLELMRKSGIPYVLIGRRCDDPNIDYVVNDDVQGGYIATRHLLDNGHKRILFLNGPNHISSARERLEGYYAAHKDTGTPPNPALIRKVGIKSGECGEVFRQIIYQGITFTAILAFSDIVALEILNELRQLGSNYSQIPVTGFDDIMAGLILPVPLVSVASAEGSASVWAANILMQRMEEKYKQQKHSAPRQIVLNVKLFYRN
jgi:LacI family transcriptional regulator